MEPQQQQAAGVKAASREDVVELSKLLGEKLQQRQARQEGICQVLCWQCLSSGSCGQVRRELYSQCMDELVRQTTITGPERGLLLLRFSLKCITILSCQVLG